MSDGQAHPMTHHREWPPDWLARVCHRGALPIMSTPLAVLAADGRGRIPIAGAVCCRAEPDAGRCPWCGAPLGRTCKRTAWRLCRTPCGKGWCMSGTSHPGGISCRVRWCPWSPGSCVSRHRAARCLSVPWLAPAPRSQTGGSPDRSLPQRAVCCQRAK